MHGLDEQEFIWVWHKVPVKPAEHEHENEDETIDVQTPPFWQGLDEHGFEMGRDIVVVLDVVAVDVVAVDVVVLDVVVVPPYNFDKEAWLIYKAIFSK